MEPLTIALLGYPLSILAGFTYEQLKKFHSKYPDTKPLKKVFIKSFYKSLNEHNKHYDKYSSDIVNDIKKKVKKDEDKLFSIISFPGETTLSIFHGKRYYNEIAEKIITEYSIEPIKDSIDISGIINDCFKYYLFSFFKFMNEKEGIQAILLECLKINSVLDILKKLNEQIVSKEDFENLRNILFKNYFSKNIEKRKKISDYDKYVKHKFKYLELRGFSPKVSGKEVRMNLLDVFVPLEINKDESVVPKIYEDPIKEQDDTEKRVEKNASLDILKHRTLVILGDPGSGKSTLLKYLAIKVTELRKSNNLLANIIPVFFRISDYSDYYKKHNKSIFEFITEHFDKQYQHIFLENFEYSNLLLLMDGLDEITETPLRLKVTEQVMDIIARYPNNRYIVTSRIVGYQESKLGGDFSHYKLLPFRNEEIELFANQWYKCIAQHTDHNLENAKTQATSLYKSISRNPSVIKIATNPLLMTIIAMIHYQGKKLPSKRVELYEISTETFLEHWVQLRIRDESQLKDKSEIIEILAPIAFDIHHYKSNALIEENEFREKFLKNFREIHTNTMIHEAKKTCDEFIKFLRQQTGFFYEKGVDDDGNKYFGFMHLTFEEYLSAIEFVSRWNEDDLNLEDFVFQSRWIEIIRLAASQIRLSFKGKAGRTLTSNFIRDILKTNDKFPEAQRSLQLACLIISDDVGISDSLLNDIIDNIFNVLSTKKYNSIVESFSNLFNELLYCEKKKLLMERFTESLSSNNTILIKNISIILLKNSEDSDVNDLLIKNLNNKIMRKEVLEYPYENYKFQKTDIYKRELLKNITDLKNVNAADENFLIYKYFSVLTKKKFGFRIKREFESLILNELKKSKDKVYFKKFLKFILYVILYDSTSKSHPSNLLYKLNKEIPFQYTRNFILSTKKLNVGKLTHEYYERSCYSIFLKYYYSILYKHEDTLTFWMCNRDFTDIKSYKFNKDEKKKFLNSLESKSITKDDIVKINNEINFILGPQMTDDDLENFLNSFKPYEDIPFDFFDWEDYPFINIVEAPAKLSNVIIKNASKYLNTFKREKFYKNITLKDYQNEDIPPPVKLLTYKKLNLTYDTSLISKSIDYFNNCSVDEKDGVFTILYSALNPFEQ